MFHHPPQPKGGHRQKLQASSHQQSPSTSGHTPERSTFTATAIRIRKYGLGKGSRHAIESTGRNIPSHKSSQSATVLNPTPALDDAFYSSEDDSRPPPPPRSMSSLSFRPFSRADSRRSTIKATRKAENVLPRHVPDPDRKVASNRTAKIARQLGVDVTPLPSRYSHAAAKRLGIPFVGPQMKVTSRPIPLDARSLSSFTEDGSMSGEAMSVSDMTDESVEGAETYVASTIRARRRDRDDRESWPLSTSTVVPVQKASVMTRFDDSTSEDEDLEDVGGSVTSQKYLKDDYEVQAPGVVQIRPQYIDLQSRQPNARVDERDMLLPATCQKSPEYWDHPTSSISRSKTPYASPRHSPAIHPPVRGQQDRDDARQELGYFQRHLTNEGNIHPALRSESALPSPALVVNDIEAHMDLAIDEADATNVIRAIFERIDNFSDLFSLAMINKGFCEVFKGNALGLMKNTLRNYSPPAWEYREASSKQMVPGLGDTIIDYTPTTYVQFQRRDEMIIKEVRTLLFSRCRMLLRQGTINALHDQKSPDAKRVDNAIWRIWTFCDLFGSGNGTENDFVGQKAWLNGTCPPVRSKSRARTRSSHRSSRSTTTNASVTSSCFGQGNAGGLSIDELEDMLELWKCFDFLLDGILGPGRVAQARRYGVFDGMDLDFSNPTAEESMLEEWKFYILTMGPQTLVDLAASVATKASTLFKTAKDMGWTSWRPCRNDACRAHFLKGVVSALIDERKQALAYEEEATAKQVIMQQARLSTETQHTANSSRKIRHSGTDSVLPDLDSSIGLWMNWQKKHEGPPTAPLPPLPPQAARKARSTPIVTKQPKPHQRYVPILPEDRPKRAPTSLSLFPPQYTRPNSPRPSTQSVGSRSPSIAALSESVHSSSSSTNGDKYGPRTDSRLSKLSTCAEVNQ